MANRTFATIKIATKEEVDNAFIVNFLKSMDYTKISPIEEFIWDENEDFIIIHYGPSLNFDAYDLVEEMSKEYPYTFSTIGHSYGNMQPTTVEYIVVYKDGEVIFEGKYPLVVFDEEGEIDDDGGYPIDEEATKTIQNKLETDKKEWFPTCYQSLEPLNPDEEDIVWKPSSKEVAEKSSEKLTEKEKDLLASMFEYLKLIGFVDVDGEEDEVLDEKELEVKTAQKIQVIQDKILGKGYSYYDSKKEEDAE